MTTMLRYARRADAIVAYTYRADIYCPGCIVQMLTDDEFLQSVNTELALNFMAENWAMPLDRGDESTFDSDDFPKVVFSSQVEEAENCGECGEEIS